jgi:hypothetical protein
MLGTISILIIKYKKLKPKTLFKLTYIEQSINTVDYDKPT